MKRFDSLRGEERCYSLAAVAWSDLAMHKTIEIFISFLCIFKDFSLIYISLFVKLYKLKNIQEQN